MNLIAVLKRREQKEGYGIKLSAALSLILEQVKPILARIPIVFPEYTPHDISHSENIMENISKFIPKPVLNKLNSMELFLLIAAAYLHDIGMAVSDDDKEEIVITEDFQQFRDKNYAELGLINDLQNKKNFEAANFYENQIFLGYIRKNHHIRSYDFIMKHYSGEEGLKIDNEIYALAIAELCKSHCLDISDLENSEFSTYYPVEGEFVNLQFLAICLRLGDILDAGQKRTPKILKEFINPKTPKSKDEWEKHLSRTSIAISERKIKINAVCKSPKFQRGLITLVDKIEYERKEAIKILNNAPGDISNKYYLEIQPIECKIESDGSYIYNDFKFSLENEKIFDLLLGTNLYNKKTVCLRELLQNSIDACRCRAQKEVRYKGKISFKLKKENINNKSIQKIIIDDNGIGMDDFVIENYFMRIGKSYYQSRDFKKEGIPFNSISIFGIGFLSCFMLADRIDVDTYKMGKEPRKLEIENRLDYFITRKGTRKEPGTTIILYLKENEKIDLIDEIKKYAKHINFSIEVDDGKRKITIIDKGYDFNIEECLNPLKKEYSKEINPYEIDLEMEKIKGLHGKIYLTFLKGFNSSYVFKSKNLSMKKYEDVPLFGIKSSGFETIENQHVLSQDGILIKGTESFFSPVDEVLPGWLDSRWIFYDINLEDEAKVDLTIDRGAIVHNKKFEDFRKQIEVILIQKINCIISKIKDKKLKNEYIELFLHYYVEYHIYSLSDQFLNDMKDKLLFKCHVSNKVDYLTYNDLLRRYGFYFFVNDSYSRPSTKRSDSIIKNYPMFPLIIQTDYEENIPQAMRSYPSKHNVVTDKKNGFSFDKFIIKNKRLLRKDNEFRYIFKMNIGSKFEGDYKNKAFTITTGYYRLVPNKIHPFIILINKNLKRFKGKDEELHNYYIEKMLDSKKDAPDKYSFSSKKIDFNNVLKFQNKILDFYVTKKILSKKDAKKYVMNKKDFCPYDL